jgi:cytochrome c-type biogenesis protein CcmE
MTSRSLKIVITLALIVGGVGLLFYSSLAETVSYYKHVDEVMAGPETWVDKDLQVHGFVEPGSIHRRIEQQVTKVDFVLENKGKRIAVRSDGAAVIPDTFKDLAEVVAKGRLQRGPNGEYHLETHEILAKCPSKYEENARTKSLAGAP